MKSNVIVFSSRLIDKKTLGYTIKRRRMFFGYNQLEFAALLGIRQTSLSNIENGRNFPSLELFFKISETLTTTMDDLTQATLPNGLEERRRKNID